MRTDPSVQAAGYPVVPVSGEPRLRRVYLKATAGKTQPFTSVIRVRDVGPAASVVGQLVVELKADGAEVNAIFPSSIPPSAPAPFGDCKTENLRVLVDEKITCPYSDFAPGREVGVTVPWVVRLVRPLAGNFAQDTATLSWHVGGVADVPTSLEDASLELVFCGPAATDPGCARAK